MLHNFIVFAILFTPPVDPPKVGPPRVPTPKPAIKATITPFVTLPVAIEGKVGAYIPIQPTTHEGCEVVEYVPITDGLNVFPAGWLKDPRNTVVSSMVAGRFKLLAYTAAGGVPSRPTITEIIIGGAPPTPPPGPGPGPGPVPPGPIRPTGLAGEIYDKIAIMPKAEVTKVDAILKSRIGAISNGVGSKATIVRDIVSDIKKIPGVSITSPWNAFIEWLKLRLIQQWPDATDDQVVEGMIAWQTATSAMIITNWLGDR